MTKLDLGVPPAYPVPEYPFQIAVSPSGDIVWEAYDPYQGSSSSLFLKAHDEPTPIFLLEETSVGEITFQPASAFHGARVVFPRSGSTANSGRLDAISLTTKKVVTGLVTGLDAPASARAVGETLYFTDSGEGAIYRKGDQDAGPTLLASGRVSLGSVRISGGEVFWLESGSVGAIAKLPGGVPGATPISNTTPDEPLDFDVDGGIVCYSERSSAELACGPASLDAFSPVPGLIGYARRVEFHEGYLYFTTWDWPTLQVLGGGGVYRVPAAKLADGTVTKADVESLVDGKARPFGLAFDAERVYFAAWASSAEDGGIYAVSKEPF